MNLALIENEIIEAVSDLVVEEIKGLSSPSNTPNTLPNLSQDRFLSETLGLGRVFQQGPIVEGIKGGVGSGIKGHRTFREVKGQMSKNLKGIAEGKAKRTVVEGNISASNIKDVIKNMKNEADLYTSYLASDTAVKMRDFVSTYENILHEGTRNKEFENIQAKELDAFGIDSVQKMIHQEIESNRQSFTDHGIRHLESNVQRQLELMDQMGTPTATDKLSALTIMVNHDMGYTIKSVREGANPGGGVHQTASGKMFDEQKSTWNEDKVFSAKQFDRISTAIKTHDSSEMSHDNLLTSTRISDKLALFAKEKLPSMFKYVKGGSKDLVQMGQAAGKNDSVAFELARKSLKQKIDASALNVNLKRDLHAAVATSNMKTPKLTLGVLAGEITSIKGDKKGNASVEIQYSAWDSFLQNHFDMGQKQTKKFLGDYGVTDFGKTDYDIGGRLKLKVIGARKKEIDDIVQKMGMPGRSGHFGHAGRIGQVGGSASGSGIPKSDLNPKEVGEAQDSSINNYEARKRESKAKNTERHGASPDWNTLFDDWGVDNIDQYKQEVNSTLSRLVPKSNVFVRTNVGDLNAILSSGEIQNAFQTNTSHGATTARGKIAFERRRYVEGVLFGIKEDAGGDRRPKYGYLSSNDGISELPRSTLKGAGGVAIRLKEGVKDRSTFTIGDSLDKAVSLVPEGLGGGWYHGADFIPQPIRKPSILGVPNGILRPVDKKGGSLGSKAKRTEQLSSWGEYVEAQIHGQIKVSDIHSVTFDKIPGSAVKNRLKKLGIPIVIAKQLKKRKEIGLGIFFKHGTHDQSTHGNWATGGKQSFGSKDPVTQEDKNLQATIGQISQMMKMNKRPEGWKNSSGYELVQKDGKFFTPALLPEGVRSGKTKECYRNAAQLAMDYPDKYTYAEGFSTSFGIPMSHAWTVDNKTGKVVDPTWSAKNKLTPGLSYYGIAFSNSYLLETIRKTKTWGIIPDYPTSSHNPVKDGFPKDAFYKKSFAEKIDLDSIKDKPKDKVNYHYIEDYLMGGNIKDVEPQGKIFLQSEMKGCMGHEPQGN